MKFSDMMGKGSKETEVEAETPETTIPPMQRSVPPVPDAPIRFGGPRTDAASAPSPVVAPPTPPEIPAAAPAAEGSTFADEIAELVPRRPAPAAPTASAAPAASASTEQVDASAWLEGISTVVDDLLPVNS